MPDKDGGWRMAPDERKILLSRNYGMRNEKDPEYDRPTELRESQGSTHEEKE
jgi:hypothetical protein